MPVTPADGQFNPNPVLSQSASYGLPRQLTEGRHRLKRFDVGVLCKLLSQPLDSIDRVLYTEPHLGSQLRGSLTSRTSLWILEGADITAASVRIADLTHVCEGERFFSYDLEK